MPPHEHTNNDVDFDEFDFDDDILDENDLVELVQHTSTSQVPPGSNLGTVKSGVEPSWQQHQQPPQYRPQLSLPAVNVLPIETQYQESGASMNSPYDFGVRGLNIGSDNGSPFPHQGYQDNWHQVAVSQNPKFHPEYTEDALPDDQDAVEMMQMINSTQNVQTNVPIVSVSEYLQAQSYEQNNESYLEDQTTDSGAMAPPVPGLDNETYQASLEAMNVQIQSLQEELHEARGKALEAENSAQTRLGEVLVLRGKIDGLTKQSTERAVHLEKKLAESAAQHQAEIESLKGEREKIVVNNQFLEHEISQAAHRPKSTMIGEASQLDRTIGLGTLPNPAETTPVRRPRLPGLGDGFDEDGTTSTISPSRLKLDSTTDRGNLKRKRQLSTSAHVQPRSATAVGDPGPLEMTVSSHQDDRMLDIEEQAALGLLNKPIMKASSRFRDSGISFFRQLILHRTAADNLSPFETLMSLSFPAVDEDSESWSLGSIILNVLEDSTPLDEDFTQELDIWIGLVTKRILELWKQSLDTEYYDAVSPLVGLLHVVVGVASIPVVSIRNLVECATRSIDLVAIPVGLQLKEGTSGLPAAVKDLEGFIPVTSILTLLDTVASMGEPDGEGTLQFWSTITYDFVLLMLVRLQPLDQILLVLKLLRSSVTYTSFGAISSADKQVRTEINLIDRLLLLLFENPQSSTGHVYSRHDILSLRLSTLQLLSAICASARGISSLASNPTTLPTLFSFLCSSLLVLYSQRQGTKKLTLIIINLTTRIVYAIVVHSGASQADTRQKIAAVAGAEYHHLTSLTRLAFSDQLWIDAGIETEVAEAAHQLLDEYLSPEEGEKLLEIFPGSYPEG